MNSEKLLPVSDSAGNSLRVFDSAGNSTDSMALQSRFGSEVGDAQRSRLATQIAQDNLDEARLNRVKAEELGYADPELRSKSGRAGLQRQAIESNLSKEAIQERSASIAANNRKLAELKAAEKGTPQPAAPAGGSKPAQPAPSVKPQVSSRSTEDILGEDYGFTNRGGGPDDDFISWLRGSRSNLDHMRPQGEHLESLINQTTRTIESYDAEIAKIMGQKNFDQRMVDDLLQGKSSHQQALDDMMKGEYISVGALNLRRKSPSAASGAVSDASAARASTTSPPAQPKPSVSSASKTSGTTKVTSEALPNPRPQTTTKTSGSVSSSLVKKERETNLYAAGGRYTELEDYHNLKQAGNREGLPTGFKARYAIKEGKMDEFMDKILLDKELAEQVRYMKQFDFDPTEMPKGAEKKFLNFYSPEGDFESVAKIDKLMSERYTDLIVPGGAGSYRKGADFDLPSGLGTTRYDPNIQKLKAGQKTQKFRRSLLGKKTGGATPIDQYALDADIDSLTYTMGTGLKQSDLEEVLLANPELFTNYLPANKRQAYYKSSGGPIYASKGTLVPYQPRGTDTVPAMLTPGEFVVNRRATRQNMGLLKAINKGQNIQPIALNRGGIVSPQYYDVGGGVSSGSSGGGGVSNISVDSSSLDAAFSNFGTHVGSLSSIVDSFVQGSSSLDGLSQAIGSLGNLGLTEGASLMANAGTSVKEATTAFSSAMTAFNTAASSLSTAIGTIPTSIALTVSGSIPITVSVQIEGDTGSGTDTTILAQSIMDRVGLAINAATQGGISIDTAIS